MSERPASLPPAFHPIFLDSVPSTNDVARDEARAGAPAFTLVVAREQLAGRGRRGRAWASPPGNLYISMVLRPACDAAQATQIGFVAAVALAETLAMHSSDLAIRVKWPNDVLVDGAKIAGILPESAGEGSAVDWLVLGCGINVATAPDDTPYPATSLAAAGLDLTPVALLEALAPEFLAWYARWEQDGFAPIRDAWLARAHRRGEDIRIRLGGKDLAGRFAGLDVDGALILDQATRGRRRITTGEIFATDN